jgi:uncharacterized membrane protein YkoI
VVSMKWRSLTAGMKRPTEGLSRASLIVLVAAVAFLTPRVFAEDNAPAQDHARAHERHRLDHDRAREALIRGEIAPLEKVLAAARSEIDGEFIGAELEADRETWIYDLKFIDRQGLLRKIYVDARTAKIISHDALR